MKNRAESVLLWGSNIWYFGEGLFGPLFAIFAEKIGGNILDISWAWALYLFIAGISKVVIGKISDGPARKERLMVCGYALNAICTFGYLLVQTPNHLFLVQVGLGLAAALATPTWEALYAIHQSRKKAGITWGLAGGEANIVSAIAIVVGSYIVEAHSFEALFLVMGVIQVIATVYQARIFFLKK